MRKRYFAKIIRCLLLLGVASFFIGVFLMKTQAGPASNTKEGTMGLAYQTETKSPGIPPIDAAAPAVFETASFGLG
jgi:hypothetical protein